MAGPDNKVVQSDDAPLTQPAVTRLPWYTLIGVRVLRTYLQSLTGLTVTVLVVPVQIPSPSGGDLYVLGPLAAALLIAAQYAIGPAVASLLQNAIELLTKLDQTMPEMRA